MHKLLIIFSLFFLLGCSSKHLLSSKSSVILIKTPTMKFYDKGFVNYFNDHIHLQIFSVGSVVLDLKIYQKKICKSSLECINADTFNEKYLHSSYQTNFLYDLFLQKEIFFKDKENNILIKVQ